MADFDYRTWLHRAATWAADHAESLARRPVRPKVEFGQTMRQISDAPPMEAEPVSNVFEDFERIIPGGMTHWQHPRFFAYFPSNSAPAAIVGEQLASALGAQCMLWQTSPAATELEIKMVDWMRQSLGLSEGFRGVLQDTASMATLCAVLTMRERATGYTSNKKGLWGQAPLRIYASSRMHSSVDRAIWFAGIGQDNLVKIPTRADLSMDASELKRVIAEDRVEGRRPCGIMINVGGTSVGATDRVREIVEIAQSENLYTHLDAAWAGSAMLCPEFRPLWDGVDGVDSIVVNAHKWLGAPMECSCQFLKAPEAQIRALSIQPEYLKTYGKDGVVNFSEWTVQLGRRFRGLKLWFLFRIYGVEELRRRIRCHVAWAQALEAQLSQEPDFEIVTSCFLSLFTFRYVPEGFAEDVDALNLRLVNAINDDGRIYLTQTRHNGQFVLRFQAGPFDMTAKDIEIAFETICSVARSLK